VGGGGHGTGGGERGLIVDQLALHGDEAAADGVKLDLRFRQS
jgi:hypothetical protein